MHSSVLFYTAIILAFFEASSAFKALDLQESSSGDITAPLTLDCTGFQHYVALGDSYAAGINSNPKGELPQCDTQPPPCNPNDVCRRNTGAYAFDFELAYKPKEFTFLACSGADTNDCLNTQVPNIPDTADLITINIGGNNNNAFSSVVKHCVYFPFAFECNSALRNASTTVSKISPTLQGLFTKIRGNHPHAQIVVMSYVRFWSNIGAPTCAQGGNFTRASVAQKTTMNDLVLQMNQHLAQAAYNQSMFFADVDPAFNGLRLCDANPAIQWNLTDTTENASYRAPGPADDDDYFLNYGVFHPTYQGQGIYAQALSNALGCSTSLDNRPASQYSVDVEL